MNHTQLDENSDKKLKNFLQMLTKNERMFFQLAPIKKTSKKRELELHYFWQESKTTCLETEREQIALSGWTLEGKKQGTIDRHPRTVKKNLFDKTVVVRFFWGLRIVFFWPKQKKLKKSAGRLCRLSFTRSLVKCNVSPRNLGFFCPPKSCFLLAIKYC